MERIVAVTVLVLISPYACRQLPHADRIAHASDRTAPAPDRIATAPDRTAPALDLTGLSEEHFAFLPTPNIATPILDSFIPKKYLKPNLPIDLASLIIQPNVPTNSVEVERPQNIPANVPTEVEWPRHKHSHPKPHHDEESRPWTKYPRKKHLIEIVPFGHNSKLKGKGKALAYILPKSDVMSKKLNKKRISGIVVNGMPNIEDIVFESSEESVYDSNQKDSSDLSDASESNSFEEYETHRAKSHKINHQSDENVAEKEFNNKVNGIVSYLNNDGNGGNRDVTSDEPDPDYQIHYIVRKKHAHTHDHSNERTHQHGHDVKQSPVQHTQSGHIYIKPPTDTLSDDVQHVEEVIRNSVLHEGKPASKDDGDSSEPFDLFNSSHNKTNEYDSQPNVDINNTHQDTSLIPFGSKSQGIREYETITGHDKTENKNAIIHGHHKKTMAIELDHGNTNDDDFREVVDKLDDGRQDYYAVENKIHHQAHNAADSNITDANTDVELNKSDVWHDASESQFITDSSSDSASVSAENNKSIADINDSQLNADTLDNTSSLENLKDSSSESAEYIADDHSDSKDEDVDDDPSIVLDDEQVFVEPRGFNDISKEKDLDWLVHPPGFNYISKENAPELVADHDSDSSEVAVGKNADKTKPGCLKTDKQNRNCDYKCRGHKSYKLTFMFNR